MFTRPEHNIIFEALQRIDARLFLDAQCYFGGGTAIVLQNGEYRLSLDIDFLCSDKDGYRELRSLMVRGVRNIFGDGIEVDPRHDAKTDQYGLRARFSLAGQPIKFEIIREGRIDVDGEIDPNLGVPALCIRDQFAEKLLANADRGLDRSVVYRDAIDLGMLVRRTGELPRDAVEKAVAAYGDDIEAKLKQVLAILSDPAPRRHVAEVMRMELEAVDAAVAALEGATAERFG